MRTLPWIRKIRDEGELKRLEAAAAEDGHGLVLPTHLALRAGAANEEFIAAAGIGSVPLVSIWTHTQKVRGRESLAMLNLIENLAAAAGIRVICVPCMADSPYRPVMERLGYTPGVETKLFYKKVG